MIKAIEIKSTEECPARLLVHGHWKGLVTQEPRGACRYIDKECLGLDSPDCPLNAIRCGDCKHKSYCSVYHVVNEAISEDGFCSGYEAI